MSLAEPSARGGHWGVLRRLLAGSWAKWTARIRARPPGGGTLRPQGRTTRRYEALLDLHRPADGGTADIVSWPTWRAVLRVPHQRPGGDELFSALVSGAQQGAAAADSHLIVTMVVVGPRPAEYPEIGDEFTLWRGGDIAHGVITRRVFV